VKRVLRSVVSDADLKLNEKMAIVCGVFLCNMTKGSPRLYRTFRHSLRSGNWKVTQAYRMVK
jgi:hypothetical protein